MTSQVIDRRRRDGTETGIDDTDRRHSMPYHPASILRAALAADAVASAGAGLLMFAGASLLATPLGLPEPLLRLAGLVLLPFAALVAVTARRPVPSRPLALAIVACNAAWVAASAAVIGAGWFSPTGLGVAFVAAQAIAVAALAIAQAVALRCLRVAIG